MMDKIEVPSNEIFSFNPDFVSFDEKDEVEENKRAQLMQTLGKTKAIYIGDF